jgi:hypothetical protein
MPPVRPTFNMGLPKTFSPRRHGSTEKTDNQ